jgi:hypothetical protein
MKLHDTTGTLLSHADGTIHLQMTKIPSLNQFYASKHWSARLKDKKIVGDYVRLQLDQYEKIRFEKMEVVFYVNYRMDLDNCIMGIKFALDAFKDWGGIPDDTKKYVQKVSIVYDKNQPKDTGKIIFSKC